MEFGHLLSSLRIVGTSSLALIGYVVVAAIWLTREYLYRAPLHEVSKTLQRFDGPDRIIALENLLGRRPPVGLPEEQYIAWARITLSEKTRVLLLIAYVATLVLVAVIVGVTIYRPPSVEDVSTPAVIRSEIQQ